MLLPIQYAYISMRTMRLRKLPNDTQQRDVTICIYVCVCLFLFIYICIQYITWNFPPITMKPTKKLMFKNFFVFSFQCLFFYLVVNFVKILNYFLAIIIPFYYSHCWSTSLHKQFIATTEKKKNTHNNFFCQH